MKSENIGNSVLISRPTTKSAKQIYEHVKELRNRKLAQIQFNILFGKDNELIPKIQARRKEWKKRFWFLFSIIDEDKLQKIMGEEIEKILAEIK